MTADAQVPLPGCYGILESLARDGVAVISGKARVNTGTCLAQLEAGDLDRTE